ncbi:unknown [Firmicutes bacterium CAG:534]|nr:unknown [Firmicutes bacterium CAG:534]
MEVRLKNKIFQSRDLCLRALDTNSACAKKCVQK